MINRNSSETSIVRSVWSLDLELKEPPRAIANLKTPICEASIAAVNDTLYIAHPDSTTSRTGVLDEETERRK